MLQNINTGPELARFETDDYFIPARKVRERYGVHYTTLWRWLKDEELDFPKPIYLGRYRHWRMSDLLEWEHKRAAKSIGVEM
jgi:predicted DNA-binding transcriptional regulator AlpA